MAPPEPLTEAQEAALEAVRLLDAATWRAVDAAGAARAAEERRREKAAADERSEAAGRRRRAAAAAARRQALDAERREQEAARAARVRAAGEAAAGPVESVLASAVAGAVAFSEAQRRELLRERAERAEAAEAGDPDALAYMIEVWRADALKGDLQAQLSLGEAYLTGRGVPKDPDEALRWFTLSAAQGHRDSQHKVLDMWAHKAKRGDDGGKWAFHMGHVFETGLYVERADLSKAMAWYNKAVKNHAYAGARERALSCERALAAAGDAEGQLNFGTSYWKGDGVAQDKGVAVEWWTKAAEQGSGDGQFFLACAMQTGEGMPGAKRDPAGALVWLQKAADEQGHAGAQKKLCDHWRARARRGDSAAQCLLGSAYAAGRGVAPSMDKALTWWTEAAEAGQSTDAMLLLADVLYHAKGVARNKQRAVAWWARAGREHGHLEALFLAGRAYAVGGGCEGGELGAGVGTDSAAAVDLWRAAAVGGHREAQFSLGNAFFYGSGTAKDVAEAKRWWSLSSANGAGNADAEHMLGIAARHDDRNRKKLVAKKVSGVSGGGGGSGKNGRVVVPDSKLVVQQQLPPSPSSPSSMPSSPLSIEDPVMGAVSGELDIFRR